MSRRKQANPRPVKAIETPSVTETVVYEKLTDDLQTQHIFTDAVCSDDSDYDEYGPLVVDTSVHDDMPESSSSQLTPPTSTSSPEISVKSNKLLIIENSPNFENVSSPPQTSPVASSNESDTASIMQISSSLANKPTRILPVSNENGDNKFVCPVCKDELGSSHDLTVHIRSHNTTTSNQANTCTICGKVLSSQSSLDRHMLVHSGERPFLCRICKMSFTTNGNMHRHTRIHTKEAELNALGVKASQKRSKAAWRPRVNYTVPNINDSGFDSSSLNLSAETSQNSAPITTVSNEEKVVEKMKRKVNNLKDFSECSVPAKRPYIPDESVSPLNISTEPPKKMLEIDLGSETTHFENKEKEPDQYHCPVCNKALKCRYGLETHLETHTDFCIKCQACNLTFSTPRELNMHKLIIHSRSKLDDDTAEKCNGMKPLVAVGFYDLSFVDFSIPKFAMIAKSWCEDNPRRSSSVYHNFACKECLKAFPSRSALSLHSNMHNPEKTTQCPLCDCDFIDNEKLKTHMLRHLSEKALAECQKSFKKADDKDSDVLKPNNMAKLDFLAMFDLKMGDKTSEESLEESAIVKQEKTENNIYFAKLGQVFSPAVSPLSPFSPFFHFSGRNKGENNADFAEIQRMLQVASGMGGLPIPNTLIPQILNRKLALQDEKSPATSPSTSPSQSSSFPYNPPCSVSSISSVPPVPVSVNVHAVSLNSSPPSTPPASDSSGNGSSGSSMTLHDFKLVNGMLPCKYCDMGFPNFRALKAHTRRTHLGLSPYKCNLCPYSSADKSTLIRHLRTHNGERPFQCQVCEFAFTTKANCERHVRKKHGKCNKEEIEDAIGYNKYVNDDSAVVDSFHSPDTVCKYCGEDFKFFRALKHHLRSHSSCRQKPFICQKCNVGFSTKANCVRHIQKQHLDVLPNQIEQSIHVNEPMLLDEMDKTDSISDDGCPLTTPSEYNGRNSATPTGMILPVTVPPAAHSTPRASPFTPTKRTESPVLHIKTEPVDVDDEEQPLDFSFKSSNPEPQKEEIEQIKSNGPDEQPIDLSVKKSPDKPIKAKKYGDKIFYSDQVHQCNFCPMGFSNTNSLERHVCQRHPLLFRSPSSTNSSFSRGLGAFANMDVHFGSNSKLKLPIKPPMTISNFHYSPSKKTFHAWPIKKQHPQLSKSLREKILPKPEIGSPGNNESDSSSDLASVNRILDATNRHSFNSFFRENMEDSEASSQEKEMEEGNEEKKPPITRVDVKQEPEEKELDQDEDEDMDSMDEEYAKMENDPTSPSLTDEELAQEELELEQNENSLLDSSLEGQKIQDSKTPAKKKRNSYADSPHKLSCPYCPRSFPWISSLTRHLLTHTGQKPFKCPRCPVTFSTKSNRERHLIRKHGVDMLDPMSRQTMDRPYKCHLCVFSSFSTQGNLLKHYRERHIGCTLPESLAELDRVTMSISSLPNVELGDELQPMELTSVDIIDDHEDIEQDISNHEDPLVIAEEKCDSEVDDHEIEESAVMKSVTFESPKPYTGAGEQQINPERDNYNVDKITECWKCNDKYTSRKLLVRHLKEHNIDLPYKCYLCDASFDNRLECLLHQEKFHVADWLILQEKNKVDTIESFSKHMDKVVENNCNKIDQGALLEIPGQGPDEMKMEVVSADYMQRKVYCSLCPKRFWSLQDLRRHMRSHTGERPFECDICQKRFTLKHSMMRHRKKHADCGSLTPSDDEEHTPDDRSKSASRAGRNAYLLPKPMSRNTSNINGEAPFSSQVKYSSIAPTTSKIITKEMKELGLRLDSDMLHNLLGVESGTIDRMLDSADSAAQLLGV